MTEYQLSSKYPDGTIAVAKGETPDAVVGSFIAFKKAYEEESSTAPVVPFPPATTTTYDQGVANALALAAPPQQPPGLNNGKLQDGQLHPTKKCEVCYQPLKAQHRMKKDGSRMFYLLECSNDYKHPKDFTENYK